MRILFAVKCVNKLLWLIGINMSTTSYFMLQWMKQRKEELEKQIAAKKKEQK